MRNVKLRGFVSATHRARSSRCIDDDFETIALLESQAAAARGKIILPGPSSPEPLSRWPQDILQRLCIDEERREVLLKLLQYGGCRHTTDYSGFYSPRETLTQVLVAVAFFLKPCPPQRFMRSCDVAKLPRYTLTWAEQNLDDGASCVLKSIEACLSPDHLKKLDEMVPYKDCKTLDTEQQAEVSAAYSCMLAWLIESRNEIFTTPLMSECILHGLCTIHAPRGLMDRNDEVLRIN